MRAGIDEADGVVGGWVVAVEVEEVFTVSLPLGRVTCVTLWGQRNLHEINVEWLVDD